VSAVNIACTTRNEIFVVTDAASYLSDGTIAKLGAKLKTVDHWPGIITGRGPTLELEFLQYYFSDRFATFDDLLSGIEADFTTITKDGTVKDVELILAGISTRGAESYVIYPDDEVAPGTTAEAAGDPTNVKPIGCKLIRLPPSVNAPFISDAMYDQSGYNGIDQAASDEAIIAALRHAIECQRHEKHPGVEAHKIGGYAHLSHVTKTGVTQTVLCEWPEDQLGECITPARINWTAWRAKHRQ
jgi:hypothetical protein